MCFSSGPSSRSPGRAVPSAGCTAGIPSLREPSSLLQGEEKAALEPQQSFLKGRVPQGEKMWCLGPKAGPGALLFSLAKQLCKHLAGVCGRFQMEKPPRAGLEGPKFGPRHLFPHGSTLRDGSPAHSLGRTNPKYQR